jgi:hypothetical protein
VHVRLEQRARTRRLTAAVSLGIFALATLAGACRHPAEPDGLAVSWTLVPAPPVTTQMTAARLTLRTPDGTPVRGARLRLEGHMAHPGMTPVVADLLERDDGIYEARLSFTMPGSWMLVAEGTLPDGRRMTRALDIAQVR